MPEVIEAKLSKRSPIQNNLYKKGNVSRVGRAILMDRKVYWTANASTCLVRSDRVVGGRQQMS